MELYGKTLGNTESTDLLDILYKLLRIIYFGIRRSGPFEFLKDTLSVDIVEKISQKTEKAQVDLILFVFAMIGNSGRCFLIWQTC